MLGETAESIVEAPTTPQPKDLMPALTSWLYLLVTGTPRGSHFLCVGIWRTLIQTPEHTWEGTMKETQRKDAPLCQGEKVNTVTSSKPSERPSLAGSTTVSIRDSETINSCCLKATHVGLFLGVPSQMSSTVSS